MIGPLLSQQIIALSQQGATAEAIAQALNEDVTSVKLILNATNHGSQEDRDINDEQLKLIRQQMASLALYGEDESTRLKACIVLLERDKPKKVETPTTSVQIVNNIIQKANAEYARLAEQYATGPISNEPRGA